MSSVPFRELVGGLQCVAQCTRQTGALAANAVISFSSDPREALWTAVRRQSEEQCHGYSDADCANDPETKRSVPGYKFVHLSGAVAWSYRS